MSRASRSRRPGFPRPVSTRSTNCSAGLRAAGLAIECRVDGSAAPLAPAADLTAYRVIQESLTNVRKHSAGRRARLALGYERRRAEHHRGRPWGCGVTLAGRGQPHPFLMLILAGGRHGIEGMRERVLAIGGRFAAGSRPGGGFRVTAALPYRPLALHRGGTRPGRDAAGEARAAGAGARGDDPGCRRR